MAETKTIMVVEDDSFLRKIYETKLSKEGYLLTVAGNGEEALEILANKTVNLILLDLVMPKMDGFTFLERKQKLEGAGKDVPVIILSNLGQQSDMERATYPDVVGYAIKSNTSLEKIVEMIGKHTI